MRLLVLLGCFLSLSLAGQIVQGPVAYYPFEGNLGDATGDAQNLGVPEGVVDFDCGVRGESALLATPGDFVRIPGGGSSNVNREFDDGDFTLSFYFKSTGGSGNQYLISKRDSSCTGEQYFFIRYAPASQTLTVTLRQGNAEATLTHILTDMSCWQHLVLVRERTELRLYLNANEVATTINTTRLNISNDGDLLIGGGGCEGNFGDSFIGQLDELRIYGFALPAAEIDPLYLNPNRVIPRSAQVFLGESIQVSVNTSCVADIIWSRPNELDDPTISNPVITPATAGRKVYRVTSTDPQGSCQARDSLILNVIDPDNLDCRQLFLPQAFTPNGIGPEANETFGISNPFSIPSLMSFEIFDRQGERVFLSNDRLSRWDGNFRGEAVDPGVLLWRVIYRCDGEELVRTGTVTILR